MRGLVKHKKSMAATLFIAVVVSLVLSLVPWNVSMTITPSGAVSIDTQVALAAYIGPTDIQTGEPLDIGDEVISKRNQGSFTTWEGGTTYTTTAYSGSINYYDEETELWQPIETNIAESTKPNWDWEVTKGHWTILIAANTTIALGKDGHWVGFRFEGVGYYRPDTGGYEILFTRNESIVPTVANNTIRWEGIVPGVNLEYVYQEDMFKENMEVTQAARDWLALHPPKDYGIPNNLAYLGAYFECDWKNAVSAYDEANSLIDWNSDHILQETITFKDITDKIVSFMPMGYAVAGDEAVPIRERFFNEYGRHWLLMGSKVLDLSALPSGTVVFDPTTFYSTTSDGYIYVTGDTWANLRSAGTGTATDNTAASYANAVWAYSYAATRYIARSFFYFDTSSIGAGSSVTVATGSLYGITLAESDVCMQEGTQADPLTTADFDSFTGAPNGSMLHDSGVGWATGQYNDFAFNATGLAAIVKDGTTKIVTREYTHEYLNSEPSSTWYRNGCYYAEQGNTTNDPKLAVTWTACSEDISNTPASKAFGTVATSTDYWSYGSAPSWPLDDSECFFTITNNSGGAVSITVQATNFTGGVGWTLASSPGENIVTLKAGKSGDALEANMITLTTSPQAFISALADSATKKWEILMKTPTSFTDGVEKSSTITLTATCD